MERGLAGVSHHLGPAMEPGEHTSQREGNMCCLGQEHGPAADQRCCSKAFEGLGTGELGAGPRMLVPRLSA